MPPDTQIVSYDTKPTEEHNTLQQAFDYFNERLFDGALPQCLITLQRKRTARGYFWSNIFTARSGDKKTDEIAMNPQCFDRSDSDILSTLVHEMIHQWQAHYGTPSRTSYHNKEWAQKMESLGLMPSDTGQPGGKRTGQRVTHYVIAGGAFEREVTTLLETGLLFRWQSNRGAAVPTGKRTDKLRYTCATCGAHVWGKGGLHLICGDCAQPMTTASER